MGEQDQVVKRLEYRGIRLIGTSDGYDTLAKGRKVMRVARGLVNELYLDDLRDKTHRGLAGQFGRGLSAGGRSFGYRTEAVDGGRRMVVDEAEAAHVRWIFEQAAEGRSPRAIAHELNQRGVASARGGTWAVSAIAGSTARGLGLLNNELYRGRVVWNRRQWLKDPETGARRYVERPQGEWQQFARRPSCASCPTTLWQRVHAGAASGPRAAARTARAPCRRRSSAACWSARDAAAPIIAINRERYGCGVHKDRGDAVCASRRTFPARDGRPPPGERAARRLLEPAAIAELQAPCARCWPARRAPTAARRRRQEAPSGAAGARSPAWSTRSPASASAPPWRPACAPPRPRPERSRRRPPSVQRRASVIDDVVSRYRRMVLQLQATLSTKAAIASARAPSWPTCSAR
jgi:site-specific DNA recombinase